MGPIETLLIALEAEDITEEVKSEAQKAVGKQSITKSADKQRDIAQTDDILGTKKNKTEKVDTNVDLEDPDVEKDTTTPIETDDDVISGAADTDGESDEDLDTDPLSDQSEEIPEDEGADSEKEDELNNKIRLRENMILFYNILSANISLLSDYVPLNPSEESSKIINKVSKNLLDCKQILFNTITNELTSNSYVELLRKYVALNRVYDISIQMLNKYFDNIELVNAPKKEIKKSKSKNDTDKK